MLIYPAIDLLGGRVVRLFQGDYNQSVTYGDDPAAFAAGFVASGATHLHLVDLDGAKAGESRNFASVSAIAKAAPSMFTELGGGIRDEEGVERCFTAGVNRVILGTAALHNPEFTKKMAKKYPGRIAVGVDARDGKVAVEGWLSTSDTDSLSFCREMFSIGIEYVIYTDISRDGAEKGANLPIYETLASIKGLHVTASGGVSSLEDIRALRSMGLYAAIMGKALYAGTVKLEDALRVAGPQTPTKQEALI